jgi:hypothetical protein
MRDVAILINSLALQLNKTVDFRTDSGIVLKLVAKPGGDVIQHERFADATTFKITLANPTRS